MIYIPNYGFFYEVKDLINILYKEKHTCMVRPEQSFLYLTEALK